MPLHVLDHPLAAHILTHLRDKTTKPATFRTLTYQITLLLAIEATRDLATEEKTIETPLEPMTARVLAHQPLVVVPILRAGLSMVQPFRRYFSRRQRRLHRTRARPHDRRSRGATTASFPRSPAGMFSSSTRCSPPAVRRCRRSTWSKRNGATDIVLLSIVSSPEGVAAVEKPHPAVPIFTAALDRELNAKKYILPGLGDFGDRLYGT